VSWISPGVRVVKIEHEPKPGVFDADRERESVGQIVGVAVWICFRLCRAACEEAKTNTIQSVLLEDRESIIGLAGIAVNDAPVFEKCEMREIGARNELLGGCIKQKEWPEDSQQEAPQDGKWR
jgi:hypothetical protein